jgi:ABC-type Fe3+/spermidine/putrescine transport system ATPase subunit
MDVYLRPADPFVAGFIGATNTLACRVAGPDRVDIGAIPLAARVPANLEPGRRGTFSIRPEHLTVGPEDGQGVPATLVGLSFLGPTLRLTLATVDDQILHADVPAVDWLARPHETGARLRWSPHAGCATVFPAEG